MYKKILPASLILLGLIVLLSLIFIHTTNISLGEVAGDVNAVISKIFAGSEPNAAETTCKTADQLIKDGKYGQARQLFQDVVDKWPNCEPAMWAQCGVAKSNIFLCDEAAAQAAIDKLIADYAGQKDIAKAVCQVADQYYQFQRHQNADKLYQKIVEKWSGGEYAMWSQMHLAMSNVRDGNDAAAQAAADKLLADYSGQKEIAIAVCLIADSYHEQRKYEKADILYLHIVNNWPDTEHGMWSQMHLAMSNIRDGNDAAAQAATDKLIANCAGQKDIAKAVCQVADQYYQLQKHQQADKLYQKVVESWPKGEYAMWSQMHLAMSNIRDGNETAAQAAIDKLLTNYAGQENITEATCQIVDQYSQLQKYQQADKFCQYVIDKWSKTEHMIWAKTGVVESNILLGNEAAAEADINDLIADFNSCPDLPMAVSLIEQQYYARGLRMQSEGRQGLAAENYKKAIALDKIVIQKFPFSDLTPRACFSSGVLYSQYLGQYQEGIEYFQKVVDNWPNYQFAYYAQFFLGSYYEKLRDANAIPAAEANPKIEEAYRSVIEKYPDSEPALHIALKLARENFEKGEYQQAVTYFEFFLGKFPDQFGSVILPLGQSYEKMGEPEMAKELYRVFIESADPSDPKIAAVKARLGKLEEQGK
jgi:outer membrane protein assembly factor BamD (BamD/ComL family)